MFALARIQIHLEVIGLLIANNLKILELQLELSSELSILLVVLKEEAGANLVVEQSVEDIVLSKLVELLDLLGFFDHFGVGHGPWMGHILETETARILSPPQNDDVVRLRSHFEIESSILLLIWRPNYFQAL